MSRLEWALGVRYALVGRGDRFVSFSSLASALGIMVGVAAIIVVMAVMNGFHINLRDRLLSASSHVETHGLAKFALQPAEVATLLEIVSADPRVVAAAPSVERQGLLSAGGNVAGVQVQGVDPALETPMGGAEIEPGFDALVAGEYGIILGQRLATRLGVDIGGRVVMLAPRQSPTLGGMVPRFRAFEVVGLAEFGLHDLNAGVAFAHHADTAAVFGVTGIDSMRLRLADVLDAPVLSRALADELTLERLRPGGPATPLRTGDWTAANATFFDALAVERRVMFVILSLIVAVAAFQIVVALVTMVRSKRAAIAILLTVGMTPGGVVRVFLIQGLLIGIAGTVAGVGLGLALAGNINPIVSTVEGVLGIDFFPGKVYFLEDIPSRVVPANVLATAGLAFILALLATVPPALTAARVDPAEALRHG